MFGLNCCFPFVESAENHKAWIGNAQIDMRLGMTEHCRDLDLVCLVCRSTGFAGIGYLRRKKSLAIHKQTRSLSRIHLKLPKVMSKQVSIRLGLENALEGADALFGDERVGLICNQASVDHCFRHAADLFSQHPRINLTTLFGPQHGIRGDVQDNMIESGHGTDKRTGLPVYSLYSETRKPTSEMLRDVDVLVFDLQDVGCRVYTFIYTMALAMEACKENGKRFIVLDRPNPINGIDVEGSLLEEGHESFVGLYPIPMRHGMTAGELAEMFNQLFAIGCDLQVVPMSGWSRDLFYDETDGPWVMPSPNMPTVDTAVVFSGTVYFEGTAISEGRGTTRPFEIVGGPYVDSSRLASSLEALNLPGVVFRPIEFIPTFQKCVDRNCGGVFLHVTDRRVFKPVLTGLAVVKSIIENHRDDFLWKDPPYEYEYDRNPFDVIAGNLSVRRICEGGGSIEDLREDCEKDVDGFKRLKERFHIY